MRDYSVGDVDREVIGRIACASLRHENEVPGSVIGRAGLRDRSHGKRACDRRAKEELFHHRFSEALAVLVMSPRQRCICKFISSVCGIKFSFKLAMITRDPARTRNTMSTPNASARTLL